MKIRFKKLYYAAYSFHRQKFFLYIKVNIIDVYYVHSLCSLILSKNLYYAGPWQPTGVHFLVRNALHEQLTIVSALFPHILFFINYIFYSIFNESLKEINQDFTAQPYFFAKLCQNNFCSVLKFLWHRKPITALKK